VLTALRSRDFRLLWLGQSVSVIGDALVIVAIGLYVTRTTGSTADVSFVLAAYATPLVVFLLVGGVVADRLPRQLVIIASSLVRAVLHGTLALLIATGTERIWHMIVIGVCYGTAEAFFRPAYTALVPQTVASDADIQGAQALGGISSELANLASPALATALVLGVGGAWAFGLDAATFLVSAALVSQVHARERGGDRPARESFLVDLAHGWHAVRDRPWVLCTIACISVALLCALAPFFVLGAAIARHVYGTEAVFGLAATAFGVGTMTGALIGSRWHPQYPMRAVIWTSALWPAAIGCYAAGPARLILYPTMAVAGVGIGISSVLWETTLAQQVPPHLLSRVSAWDWMGSLALLPLGYVLSGWLGHLIGNARLLQVGGAIGTVSLLLALLPRSTRTLRRLGDAPVGGESVTAPLAAPIASAQLRQ
jgi:MFS family permease